MPTLLAGFVFGYYGKEQYYRFTPGEVAAIQHMYDTIPKGSLIVAATDDFPGAYTDYPDYGHTWFAQQTPDLSRAMVADPVDELLRLVAGVDNGNAYLVLTRSEEIEVDSMGLLPAGTLTRTQQRLDAMSWYFTVIYRGPDAVITRLSPLPHDTGADQNVRPDAPRQSGG
jgi:hypothetical protein